MGGDAALKLVRQEIRRLAQMLRELEARSGAGRVPADPKHHAWIIWAVAYRYCITVAGHLDAVCTAVFDGMADCATSHSHWLRVDVELASPREYAGSAQLYKFYLEATYDLPAQIRRREGVAVRAGSENRLCSFELPFMAKGTLTAGLGPRDSARFRYLDGMARIVRISVQPGGEEATSTKPRIWQNTATERANVTLNLGPDHLTLA